MTVICVPPLLASALVYGVARLRRLGAEKSHPPFVLQKSLGDFCVVYEINAYCRDATAIARTGWPFAGMKVPSPVDLANNMSDRLPLTRSR